MILSLRNFLIRSLSKEKRDLIKKIALPIASFVFRKNLEKLAVIHGTDKYGSHWYATHYQHHFKKFRKRKVNVLEIGVGGGDKPHEGGDSLRMWKSFFRKGKIFGVDIYDKKPHEERRIKIFKGDQSDEGFLKKVKEEIGEIDIIIDDGSHVNEHIITSFQVLFPLLKNGGIYVIEDMQTSYWPSYGGMSKFESQDTSTSVNYAKSLIDSLNYQEFLIPAYKPSYFDKHITALHFYHNMVFIYKGKNDELSNMVVDGKLRS